MAPQKPKAKTAKDVKSSGRSRAKTPLKKSKKHLQGFKPVEGEIVEAEILDAEALTRPEDDVLHAADGLAEDPVLAEDPTFEKLFAPEIKPLAPSPSSSSKSIAPADPVARYMAEIGRYSLLTKEQEHELAKRYKETGDAKAAEVLVTSNLRFVVKVAAEYTRFGARLIDLIQEGNVGLMHAVKEFNPYKGTRLITYAVWWIRGYIQEYLMRQYSMVRIGTTATQRKLFYQLQREREELERIGIDQGLAQLSGRLGINENEAQAMHQRLSGRDVSLDNPVGEDGRTRLLDLQSDSESKSLDDELGSREEIAQMLSKIEQLKPSLNERELFLLEARLLADEPMTLQEIGDKYGTTREAVRQMESRLMQKIKHLVLSQT